MNNIINKEIYNEINNIQSQKPNIIFKKNIKKGFNLLTRGIKRNGLKIAIILLILFIIIGFIYTYPTPIDGSYQDNATPGQRIASLFIIAALTSVITMTLTIFDSESERHQEKDKEINQIKCKYNEFIFQLSKKYLSLNIHYILKNEISDEIIKEIYIKYINNILKKDITLKPKNTSSILPIPYNISNYTDLDKKYFYKINNIILNRIRVLYIYNLILQDKYLSELYLLVLKELDNIFYDKDININENIKLKEESIIIKLNEIQTKLIKKIDNITDSVKSNKKINTNIINNCTNYYYNDILNIYEIIETKNIEIKNIKNMLEKHINNEYTDKYIQDLILFGPNDQNNQNNISLVQFIKNIFKMICKIDNIDNIDDIDKMDNIHIELPCIGCSK
jgi:hypothetical protein